MNDEEETPRQALRGALRGKLRAWSSLSARCSEPCVNQPCREKSRCQLKHLGRKVQLGAEVAHSRGALIARRPPLFPERER